MAGGGKHKLEYVQQECPKFLRDFKAKVNYKEGPTVESKRKKLEDNTESDEEERDDEKPVICVLKQGDLTEEEVERERGKDNSVEGKKDSGKIFFRKPSKAKVSSKEENKLTERKGKRKSVSRKIKDPKLLSFDDEEDGDV